MEKKIVEELKVSNFETSALNGKGIKSAFDHLVNDIKIKRGLIKRDNENKGFTLNKEKEKKKKNNFC